ncbi:MAG: glycosyltransferase family 2 protein [Pseudomonadota bacterium]
MSAAAPAVPRVSVLVPTFEQAAFLPRALDSLLAQTLADWEAIVIDDGSMDDTREVLAPWLDDPRLRLAANTRNEGLGRALNIGLDMARAPLVAYLPSDDLYYRAHLAGLAALLEGDDGAVLAVAGMRHHYNRESAGALPGLWPQLVQCMHRRCALRWIERAELESDDLDRLFWTRLRARGRVVQGGAVSCEWVDHPDQRHKLMQEPEGGLNPFRQRYRVSGPLRFHSSKGNAVDEAAQYRTVRAQAGAPEAGGLKILLVGELAYNADRVLALAGQGHALYGLWMRRPYWYNTVGPLPFGQVEDLPYPGWREAVARLQPDIIYGLLNWQAVPFAHEVMLATPGIPFAWHFKEGPFICLEKGTWPLLVDLYRRADGRIFSSPEMRDWFDTVVPGLSRTRPSHVLDGDLPRQAWFAGEHTALLSAGGHALHTVVPGRPIGLHPHTVAALAEQDLHLHFYGDYTQGQWRDWIDRTRALAPRHLHLHPNVDQDRWVAEFSRYDAGWLHAFESANGGELRRANWDDLNYPARLATLAAGGLPMIQRENGGAIVATQALAEKLGIGVFYRTIPELAERLRDRQALGATRARVLAARGEFCFDTHAPALVDFFRRVIASGGAGSRKPA